MILVQLLGGMGNQMFQYAAGRALAQRTGAPPRLDTRALDDRASGITPRPYALSPFRITGTIASPQALNTFRLRRRLKLAHYLRETSHAYNAAFASAGRDVCLIGYWQSERYFADIASIIRQEFTLSAPPKPDAASLLAEIADRESVSVHIRRGDYVADPTTKAFHGLMPLSYYERAAALLMETGASPHFYVFSDEPAWARDNLRLPGPMTVVDLHGPDEPHEDLRLMRACQHHIIANSSFSWWGAWLADWPGKRVCAPRQWFRDTSVDTTDVCPPDWIRL